MNEAADPGQKGRQDERVAVPAGGDLRPWLRNLVDVGAPLRVWTAAVLVPVGLYVLALGVFLLAGGSFDRTSVLPAAAVPAVVFATFVRGGLEEPG